MKVLARLEQLPSVHIISIAVSFLTKLLFLIPNHLLIAQNHSHIILFFPLLAMKLFSK
jgi:hypothetical protein